MNATLDSPELDTEPLYVVPIIAAVKGAKAQRVLEGGFRQ